MARNIRNISTTAFTVNFGFVTDGELKQGTIEVETNSPRKVTAIVARELKLDPAQVVIIGSEKVETNYRILDVNAAMKALVDTGLAMVVDGDDEVSDEVDDEAGEE